MNKKNFESYQDKLNRNFDKAYNRAIKDMADGQTQPAPEAPKRPATRPLFGSSPKPASTGYGSGSKYPTIDLNDSYLKELDNFVKFVLAQISTFEKSEPGPETVRRTFDDWVLKLNDLKQNNIVQAKTIDIAIKNLWALYKNEVKKGPNMGRQEDKGNLRLRLSMFADVHWWDKVRKIFTELNKYIQRSFVRPVVAQLPRPGTAPQIVSIDPNDYAVNEKTGKRERVYSADKLLIIDSIRKFAIKVLLVSKNVETNISSVESIMPLYYSSINALIREETEIASDWVSTFKSMKINLHFFNKIRNAVQDPKDEIIIQRLEKEKKYAESVVKNNPERVKVNMNIYGTKLSEYDGNDSNHGFRKRMAAVREANSPPGSLREEGEKVYELRKEIFGIYGEGYLAYQLKLAVEEADRKQKQRDEVDDELSSAIPRENQRFSTTQLSDVVQKGQLSLEDYLKKGNYIDPSHVVFGTRVSAASFRKYDPKLDAGMDIYEARAEIWGLWSKAFLIQLAEFNKLVAELRKAENAKKGDIADEYYGTRVNASKFRDYDVKIDNNKTFYLIKKRIWSTYHSYQVAYENDIVIGDFGALYEKTVDFVDGFILSIEQITKDPKSFGVLGSTGSPIMSNFQEMINDLEEFNNIYTTTPWTKSFILSKGMLSSGSDNDYINRLSSLKNNVDKISIDLKLIVESINDETEALQVLIRSIAKINPDKNNSDKNNLDKSSPFLDYYNDLNFPQNNSELSIATFINDYLKTTKDAEYDAYGISYILGQI